MITKINAFQANICCAGDLLKLRYSHEKRLRELHRQIWNFRWCFRRQRALGIFHYRRSVLGRKMVTMKYLVGNTNNYNRYVLQHLSFDVINLTRSEWNICWIHSSFLEMRYRTELLTNDYQSSASTTVNSTSSFTKQDSLRKRVYVGVHSMKKLVMIIVLGKK